MQRFHRIGLKGLCRILFAFSCVCLEAIVRCFLVFVPSSVTAWVETGAARVMASVVGSGKASRVSASSPTCDLTDMSSVELIAHFGFTAEAHMVETRDGYNLGLHRLYQGKAPRGPPILMMHGLMTNSEIWVCHEDSLAFHLAAQGYDVWLGNNRGNKYSCKHRAHSVGSSQFWDFAIDDLALFDVPCMIYCVLDRTGADRLAYVGFSQGTAQAFACFSVMPQVASKVSLFVALSPAAKAKGLRAGLLQSLVHIAPSVLYFFFGTKAMLTSTLFWRRVLPPLVFARAMDTAVHHLFGWTTKNLGSISRKLSLYYHLFSYSSTKNVVQWFQIVRADKFQEFDENSEYGKGYKGIQPLEYPIGQIKIPMALFYGTADELTDIDYILERAPEAHQFPIDGYEHLDSIWAEDATTKVYEHVLQLVRTNLIDPSH